MTTIKLNAKKLLGYRLTAAATTAKNGEKGPAAVLIGAKNGSKGAPAIKLGAKNGGKGPTALTGAKTGVKGGSA
jgi:hypothetical protein